MLTHEIEQRERQLVDDKFQDQRLARLKSEFMNEQEKLAELLREEQRRNATIESEIEMKQKQIQTIQTEAAKIEERSKFDVRKKTPNENVTMSPDPVNIQPQPS